MGSSTPTNPTKAGLGATAGAYPIHYGTVKRADNGKPRRNFNMEYNDQPSLLQPHGALVHDSSGRAGSVEFTDQEEYAQFLGWCCYDKDAADYLVTLFKFSQKVDDIADGECKNLLVTLVMLVNDSTICMASNRFFARHASILTPVMLCSLMNWYVSTKWEKERNEEKQRFAYVLRESLEQVIFLVAYLVGGIEHAMAVAENVLEFYHVTHPEGFEAWRAKL